MFLKFDLIIHLQDFHKCFLGIESLFNKINCDQTAISDLLGSSSGITDSNMLQYLGIIEQRTNELLAVQTFLNMKVCLFETSLHFKTPLIFPHSSVLCV